MGTKKPKGLIATSKAKAGLIRLDIGETIIWGCSITGLCRPCCAHSKECSEQDDDRGSIPRCSTKIRIVQ